MKQLVADLRKSGLLTQLLFLLAAGVAVYPLYAYFAHRAPPLWPGVALVTFAWAAYLVIEGALRIDRIPPGARRASLSTVLGVALLALCHVGLERWTLLTPDEWPRERIQTGFGMRDWTLTPEARAFLEREDASMRAPDELMLAFGAYDQSKAYLVWKSETIYIAGCLLILLHALGVASLAHGLVGLARARNRAIEQARGGSLWEAALSAPRRRATESRTAAPKRLVVVVPAIRGRVSQWDDLLTRLRKEPELHEATWLLWDHGQGLGSRASVRSLALSLCARVDTEVAKSGEFEDVVLVGHSLGGLIVRQAYLFSCGVEPHVCQQRAWHSRISRIVLLAALNRGVAIEKGAPLLHRIAGLSLTLFPYLDRFLVFQLLQGSDFVTSLRIEWIRHFARLGASAPAVVQLLGTEDRLVRMEDSLDVKQFRNGWQILVPDAGHGDLNRLGGVSDPEGRYLLIRQALLQAVPDKTADPKVQGARTYVFVLHGIRAGNEQWPRDAAEALVSRMDPDSTRIVHSSYGYLSALRFALPPTRRARLQWFQDLYSSCLAENPDADFHFIGHSNGTYLLGESLRRIPSMRFRRVVLAGSVLPAEYPWDERFQRSQVETLRNHRSSHDVPVAILCSLLRGLGMRDVGTGGAFGFRTVARPVEEEIFWYVGGHSRPIDDENLPTLVEFVATGKDAGSKAVRRDVNPRWFRRLSRASGLLGPPMVVSWCLFPVGAGFMMAEATPVVAIWAAATLATCMALELI